jgi:hypothetical protein
MDIISLLLVIVVLGLAVYLIDRYVPMAEPFKIIFRVVIVVAFVVYLLKQIGYNVPLHLH